MTKSWSDAFFGQVESLERPSMLLVNAFVDPPEGDAASKDSLFFGGNPAAVCKLREGIQYRGFYYFVLQTTPRLTAKGLQSVTHISLYI